MYQLMGVVWTLMQVDTPSKRLDRPNDGTTCGAKWKCGQMNSCEEANYYLNQCGLGRLDGDGDGVPCESTC